jgi:hypothetical protein
VLTTTTAAVPPPDPVPPAAAAATAAAAPEPPAAAPPGASDPPPPSPAAADPPPTCSPTVTLTAATVPAKGAVRVASAAFCRATWSWARAESTAASSASIWALEASASRSAASRASAEASAERAWATCPGSEAASTAASSCPAVTCWPTTTDTDSTRPPAGKSRSARWLGSIVPVTTTVRSSMPVRAVANSGSGVAVARTTSQTVTATAASTSTAAAVYHRGCRRNTRTITVIGPACLSEHRDAPQGAHASPGAPPR